MDLLLSDKDELTRADLCHACIDGFFRSNLHVITKTYFYSRFARLKRNDHIKSCRFLGDYVTLSYNIDGGQTGMVLACDQDVA